MSNTSRPFFYLGGPITDVPDLNRPRFHAVSKILRNNGYNIVSPVELDVLDEDFDSKTYPELLARDITIVCLPTCVGGIFLENWQESRGAKAEMYVLRTLSKQVLEYSETGVFDLPRLTAIADAPLSNAGAIV